MQAQPASDDEQVVAVRTYQVSHAVPPYPVAVQPDATVEGVAHAVTAVWELPDVRVYRQTIWPSVVAGPTAGPAPENR